MCRLLLLLLCIQLADSAVLIGNLATGTASGTGTTLQTSATTTNARLKCVSFTLTGTLAPMTVTKASFSISSFIPPTGTTSIPNAFATIQPDASGLPGTGTACILDAFNSQGTSSTIYSTTPLSPVPCNLNPDTLYWLCLSNRLGSMVWDTTTTIPTSDFLTVSNMAWVLGDNTAGTTYSTTTGPNLFSLEGVVYYSPSPSPSTPATSPIASSSSGSSSGLYGLFALIVLPLLCCAAAAGYCCWWFFLTPAGIRWREEEEQRMEPVPPPIPIGAPTPVAYPTMYMPVPYTPAVPSAIVITPTYVV